MSEDDTASFHTAAQEKDTQDEDLDEINDFIAALGHENRQPTACFHVLALQ